MKTLCSIYLIIHLVIPAIGQNNYLNTDDLRRFYSLINQAELNIVDGNLFDAINVYRSAAKIRTLSYTDRLNLIQCLLETERMSEAVGSVIQMSKDGYRMQFLFDKKYEDLVNDENWIYFVENEFQPPVISNYTKNIFHILDNVRQYHEIMSPEKKLFYLSIVSEGLRSHIGKEGYPSETVLEYGSNENTKSRFESMIRFCAEEDRFNYDSLLYEELIKGHIEPETLLRLFTYDNEQSCGCVTYQNMIFVMIGDSLFSCTPKQEEIANLNRHKLFLPSVSDTKKFIEFQLTNPNYNLRCGINGLIFIEFPEKEKQTAYLELNAERLQLIRVRKENEILRFSD